MPGDNDLQWFRNAPRNQAPRNLVGDATTGDWARNPAQGSRVQQVEPFDRPTGATSRQADERHLDLVLGGVATATVIDSATTAIDGTGDSAQVSTTGSGSGVVMSMTILTGVATIAGVTTPGAGYAVGDDITLDLSGGPVVIRVATLVAA